MRIGIDLGGTKIEAVALDRTGSILEKRRIPAPRGSYDKTVRAVSDLVAALEETLGRPATVGIGMPGALSRTSGLIKNANSTWLNGHPFDKDMAAALGRPVRCSNDANCFALSEAADGAARDADVVFGAILGTGTGGGIVVGNKILEGGNAIAGEWGHNPLPWPEPRELPGPQCFCGKRGCIERWISGPALEQQASDEGLAVDDARSVAELAEQGDEKAVAVMKAHALRVAKALASVVNLIDPDVIVLGGGLSNLSHLYDEVPRLWARFITSDTVATVLLPPEHGDASGVRGAAWLWSAAEDPEAAGGTAAATPGGKR